MSNKVEKTSNESHQHHRLSIFFRSLTLLKIVAWLSSLSLIGSTGVVWADVKPISTNSNTEEQALVQASTRSNAPEYIERNNRDVRERDIYHSQLPNAQSLASILVSADQLPNREVPTAVAPGSASTIPASRIVRPQHANLLIADNYTVGVNGAGTSRMKPAELTAVSVPASLRPNLPHHHEEILTTTKSQVRSSSVTQQTAIDRSTPANPQLATGYRSVPTVSSLPTAAAIETGARKDSSRTGLKTAVVKPIRPAITTTRSSIATSDSQRRSILVPSGFTNDPSAQTAQTIASIQVGSALSIEIPVPSPRTKIVPVQPVAQLPQVTTTKAVPTVPAIPSVRSASTRSQPGDLAFANNQLGESSLSLIYPLSSPAPTTSTYGWRTHPITGSRRFHSGIDIGAPMGAPVVAAGSGTIISAGWVGGYGKAIVIQHNGVQQTLYGHLSEVFVQPGQTIQQGAVIGRVGSTGNSTGPHLHFEARMSSSEGWVAVDPSEDIQYALDNLRRATPFAQRDFTPAVN
jgi:murein DD-endopeptidase MepM/ murein hydrolase activator NlpD